MHNYRLFESWMQKGAEVKLANNTGIVDNIVTANIGNETVVLTASIRPTGVIHPFPFNPWDLQQIVIS